MQNWDLSLNNPILLKLLTIYLKIKIIQSQFYVKLTRNDRVQEGDIVHNINKMSALSGVRQRTGDTYSDTSLTPQNQIYLQLTERTSSSVTKL